MTRTITIKPCSCGHRACKRFELVGIGHFYQGTGFTEAEAKRIAELINNDPDFPWDPEQ